MTTNRMAESSRVDPMLLERVRHRLAADPRQAVTAVLRDEAVLLADDAVLDQLRHDVDAELRGAGCLEPLLALPGVTDVLVNAPDEVWVDRGEGLMRARVAFPDDAAVRRLAQRLAVSAGRRLDDASPFVDAVLGDGTRLHAVLPPVTPRTTISLRTLARRRFSLDDLVAAGSLPREISEVLRAIIAARLTFVISGGAGSGKTTLLGALLGCAHPFERLVLIEDAAELVTQHPHVVRLSTRPANVEGMGAIGLRDLVRESLRMRPDRIVVGEFRGAEVVELLTALNTGHEGGAATLHANTAADVPARLEALAALGGLSQSAVAAQAASALEVVVQLRRIRGRRHVDEIGLITSIDARLRVQPVWSAAAGVISGGAMAALLTRRAVDVPPILKGGLA